MIKIRILKPITEGGNIFGDKTDSIPLNFIEPTLNAYYAELARLFPQHSENFNKETMPPLGSVGKKAKSGDIDLAVNAQTFFEDGVVTPTGLASWNIDPEVWKERLKKLAKRARAGALEARKEARAALENWQDDVLPEMSDAAKQIITRLGWKAFLQSLADYINEESQLIEAGTKKISDTAMFSVFPQYNEAGEAQNIGVQMDWMVGNVDWLSFSYYSGAPLEEEPLLKGLHRTQLISAIALVKDYSFFHAKGVKNRETGEFVATTPDEILNLIGDLYGNPITRDDTENFNTLYAWLNSENIDEEDRYNALRAYLVILDRTNGNKDLDGTRCGYIPKALEQMYATLYQNNALKGKYLCKEANPDLWALANNTIQEVDDNSEKIIVVIPGGFKPPHRGHVEMINHFANLPEVDEVIIFTGTSPRQSDDGSIVVTKDKSIQLFNLFDLAPNVRFGDIAQRPKKNGGTYENPFMDAVNVLFDENFSGKKVAIGHPTKDSSYSEKFAKVASYIKKPMAAELVQVAPADTTGGLSATDLRNAVQSGDQEELKKFIPDNIAEQYLRILIGD